MLAVRTSSHAERVSCQPAVLETAVESARIVCRRSWGGRRNRFEKDEGSVVFASGLHAS